MSDPTGVRSTARHDSQSLEKLVDSGLVAGVIDVTTTEVADFLVGGVFPCTADRFGAIARTASALGAVIRYKDNDCLRETASEQRNVVVGTSREHAVNIGPHPLRERGLVRRAGRVDHAEQRVLYQIQPRVVGDEQIPLL